MSSFDLAESFPFFARQLHGTQLLLSENDVFLGGLSFQSFQPLAEGFQIAPQPDAANPC
jgi:hypothetical protein